MVPSQEEEVAEGYQFEPPYPFVKALVGDNPEHHLAYDVSTYRNSPTASQSLLISRQTALETPRPEA